MRSGRFDIGDERGGERAPRVERKIMRMGKDERIAKTLPRSGLVAKPPNPMGGQGCRYEETWEEVLVT